ncbi:MULTISPECIES: LysR family transcriptional regulator [Rhodomicrobium]|uniref:LysR family transcriptional regulator n=1 Tax=Rhodomicrobium TaxID=1068 RepID=UPI001481ED2E|nr:MULTISPECIES: LysR family transcriptional regulator [Rhodomicrobium]
MDLNTIQTFADVVRAGGFSAAARQSGMPRSTVSLRVRMLEEALGVRLFKRSTRAIALTSEGRALFDSAGPVLDRLAEAVIAVGGVQGELKGPIRITAPADFPTDGLADALGSFRREHPKVSFEVILTNAVLDLVAENIDIALRIGAENQQDTVTRAVLDAAYGLFASPAYFDANGEPRDANAIQTLIAPPRILRRFIERQVFEARSLPDPAIEANNFLLIRDLAVAGHGIGLLPVGLCKKEIAAGTLRQTLRSLFTGSVRMGLSFPTRSDMNARVRAFADHLARRLLNPGGWQHEQ